MNKQREDRTPAGNSTYKKLAVQWLNEVQFFNQTFEQVDSLVLRNPQLLIAEDRYGQFDEETTNDKSHRLYRKKNKKVRKVSKDECSKTVGINAETATKMKY